MKNVWSSISVPVGVKEAFNSCKENSLEKNEKTLTKLVSFWKAHQPPQ
jgi:hypothetical protein